MDEKIIKRRIIFRRLIQAFMVLAIIIMGLSPISVENDIYWQLKMGEDIWERHYFPIVDPYNFSNPGAVWTLEEWIPSTIFYVFSKYFGIASLTFLKVAVLAITYILFFRLFNKLKVNFYLSFFVFLLAAMVNSRGMWVVYPSIFEYLFIVLTLYLLEYSRKISWKTFWALVILSLVWVNAHASFFLQTAIIFSYTFGSLVVWIVKKRFPNYQPVGLILDRREGLKLFLAGLITLVTPFLSPNGYWTFIYPFRISFGPFTSYVSEYQKYWQIWNWNWADFVHGFTFILILFLAVTFWAAWRKLQPGDLMITIVFIYLAMTAIRHVAIFALIALFILAKYITVWFGEYRGFFKRTLIKDLLLVIFIVCFLFYYKTNVVGFGVGFSDEGFPKKAAEFVMDNKIEGNMFNHYNYGGYLIWKMPGYKVFIDGRLEMYQEQAGKDYLKVINSEPGYEDVLAKYDINYFIMYNTDPVIGTLLKNSQWYYVYSDRQYTVFLKNSEINKQLIEKYWNQKDQDTFTQGYYEYFANQAINLGLEQVKKSNFLPAARYFEKALEYNPNLLTARLNLAKSFLRLGWWNEAKTQYEAVLEIDKQNEEAKTNLMKMKEIGI